MSRDLADGMNRRQLLTAASGTMALLAGCPSGDGDGDGGGGGDGGDGGSGTPAAGEQVGPLTVMSHDLLNYEDIGREWMNQLSALGVEFNHEVMPFETWLSEMLTSAEEANYEHIGMTTEGVSPARIDPSYYLSTNISDYPTNQSGFSNDRYDELFEEQLQTLDREQRSEHIQEMQQILFENLPDIMIIWFNSSAPYNSDRWDMDVMDFMGAVPQAQTTIFNAEPQTDDATLRIGGQQLFGAPNPTAENSTAMGYVWQFVYDTLRKYNADAEIIDWAVDSWEATSDTTYEASLRDGMTFHDGESVTAEDVAFTWNFIIENEVGQYASFYENIDGVSALDELTVEFSTESPDATFGVNATTAVPIFPKHIWETIPEDTNPIDWSPGQDQLIGSGPYEISQKSETETVFTRFDDHFHDAKPEEIIYVNRPSTESIRAGLVNDEIDMTTEGYGPPSALQQYQDADNLTVPDVPGLISMNFSFRLSEAPMSDFAFRKACWHVTDGQKLSEVFALGLTRFSDGTWAHPEAPLTNPDLPKIEEPNVEEAKQTLRDAGYTYQNGTLHYPDE